MHILKPVVSTLLLCSIAACATTGGLTTTESVSRLEQQRQANPSSAPVSRSLGIAYFKAKRYAEARSALESSLKIDPKDGTTALYLGLTLEELGDLAGAKTAYSSYIQYGRTSRVRSQLQARLAALTRKEITAEAKAAVKQEAALSSRPASPRTIAVMPLRFSGADTSLRPLERGFADLLTTDLARSAQLTLVERSRLQALLEEMKLQRSGATDANTNVRAGKLLAAGRLVQGAINQVGAQNLRVDAAVVDVPTSEIKGTASGADLLEQIFNLEKKIALDLFTQLGVNLTVSERNAVEQRPTRSLAAFLSYSRGLRAEDEGRYDEASRYFQEAVRLDPGFGAAQQKSQEVRAVATGADVTASTVEVSLKGTSEGAVVSAATQGAAPASGAGTLGTTAQIAAGDLNPSPTAGATLGSSTGGGASVPPSKDPVSAATGSDNPIAQAKVVIVITRPKTP